VKWYLNAVLIPVFFYLSFSGPLCAEEMTVVRGGQEELQAAIEDRTKEGPSAGFAAPLPSKNQKKQNPPAAVPRPNAGPQSVLVPANEDAIISAPAVTSEAETSEYDKSLELSPQRRFSRDLDRHDSFEDELAQSSLEDVRDNYTVDEGDETPAASGGLI